MKNILNLNKYKIKKYLRNTVIYKENDNCTNLSYILNGEISIGTYLENGSYLEYNHLIKGECFGNNLLFSDNPFYKGDVICMDDCQIIEIDKEEVLFLLQSNKDFLLYFLNLNSNFTKDLNSKIKLLSFNKIEDRLLYYLHINNNKLNINSINDLAITLGCSREALSRLLNKKYKNLIKKKGK